MPTAPSIQHAISTIEAELKHRIHTAAAEAVTLAYDIAMLVEKTDEELQQAYNALRASVGLRQQEEQQAQSVAAMAADRVKAEAIAQAAATAAVQGATAVGAPGGKLTLVEKKPE